MIDLGIPQQILTMDARMLLALLPPGCTPLIHWDAPWHYSGGQTNARRGLAAPRYRGNVLHDGDIAAMFGQSIRIAAPCAYAPFWITFPKAEQWSGAWYGFRHTLSAKQRKMQWRGVSGGSWHKKDDQGDPSFGVGYHFRSSAEALILYERGGMLPLVKPFVNAWDTPRGEHSRKPEIALIQFVLMATRPGDLVVEPFAGEYGDLARICRELGRRYIGAEIDPERAALARMRATQQTLFPMPVTWGILYDTQDTHAAAAQTPAQAEMPRLWPDTDDLGV